MKYLIYCKKTHKLLAVYTNAKSLETLNTDKCYYKEQAEVKANKRSNDSSSKQKKRSEDVKLSDRFGTPSGYSSAKENRNSSDISNDYMSPSNPIGFYASSYSSDSNCSSSSDSYSSSPSSSSCDSSSY